MLDKLVNKEKCKSNEEIESKLQEEEQNHEEEPSAAETGFAGLNYGPQPQQQQWQQPQSQEQPGTCLDTMAMMVHP